MHRRSELCAVVLVLCLFVCMLIRLSANPTHGVLDGSLLAIPYRSPAGAYAAHALYSAPLPTGSSEDHLAEKEGRGLAAKVRRRINRQKTLEDELNGYLRSVGVERDRPVRVRFHILSNFVDWKLCTALGAASLGGFSIPVTGFNKSYSHIHRFDTYLDFVKREGLRDEDIVVTLDSDVFWTGADFMPFLKKFARYSPETEADLDVAAVRAWEDYGEKNAPLLMQRLMRHNPRQPNRPLLQLPPVVYNADDLCWWGQHSDGFVRCPVAFAAMEHMIEVARNRRSSYTMGSLGRYVKQCATSVYKDLQESFGESRAWMVESMFGMPNASSPYTDHAVLPQDDPLFYRPSTVTKANPVSLLNGGMHVSRVWALRHLASTLATYVEEETPVAEAEDHKTSEWWCDQALFGQIYVRARLFEIEHDLLEGPTGSQRQPPLAYDPRFGPPGFLGVDRRSEMVALAPTMERHPHLFHHGGYLDRQFPQSTSMWVRNRTHFLLGEDWPEEEEMDGLEMTRGGALVTPPLLWRSATPEDRARGLENAEEMDADTVHVPFIHYAAPTKHPRFSAHRNHYAWLVAARHDRRAREAAFNALSEEVVELWFNDRRVFVEYKQMCEDPMMLAPPNA